MENNDEEEPTIECKVVLLGESDMGKKSFFYHFINDENNTNDSLEDNTITSQEEKIMDTFAGKTITFNEILGKTVKFQLWNTSSQEKYRPLIKMFFHEANAVILIYDITQKETFEEIKKFWYNQVKQYAPKDISKF